MFDKFSERHIGVSNEKDLKAMLDVIGVKSTDELIAQMSCVGSVLIFAVSLNMIRKDKIKVGNLLPAVFLPAVFYLLARFFPVLGTL